MKLLFVHAFFILYSLYSFGQNLVPNYSFENYSNCPTNMTEINYSNNWFQPLPQSTSDYFNSCDVTNNLSVPINVFGYQKARTGNAYAGILLYNQNNWKEYIETKLISPLNKNSKYCVSFYVSLINTAHWGIDAIGAYLSKDSILSDTMITLPYSPQIENHSGNIIIDTLNWIEISDTIIAQGGEYFLTIGNFHEDINTNHINLNYGSYDSYYYIDDVSVLYCDTIYKAEAGKNKTICEGDSVQIGLPPNADCHYKWQATTTLSNDSIANPWVKPTVNTVYYLQQTFMSNKTTDSVKVTVISCEDTLKNSLTIPNAFTPNGDGVNDYFKIKGSNIRSLTGKIFNRWGEELFKFNDANSKWDGKYKGKTVSDGVYFYIITATFNNGEVQEKHGAIEVVR